MNTFYKFTFIIVLSCLFINKNYAQKTITVYVHSIEVQGLSTGCDCCGGNEDPRWYFTNNYQSSDPCYEHSQSTTGVVTHSKNGSGDIISSIVRDCNSLFPTNYNARCRACENDGASCWTASICDGAQADFNSGDINLQSIAGTN